MKQKIHETVRLFIAVGFLPAFLLVGGLQLKSQGESAGLHDEVGGIEMAALTFGAATVQKNRALCPCSGPAGAGRMQYMTMETRGESETIQTRGTHLPVLLENIGKREHGKKRNVSRNSRVIIW
ncbi:MAG: hypothetical protein GF401_20900 [Chitinivibrionales bacterium]|nr:hypothetical protein [Chitinivibrionales bacterium]